MSDKKCLKDKIGLREDLLMENYEYPVFLPPLWRVIFQEGIRGFHIIFPLGQVGRPIRPESGGNISKVAALLLAAPDLGEIKKIILSLGDDDRGELFTVYLAILKVLEMENQEWQN